MRSTIKVFFSLCLSLASIWATASEVKVHKAIQFAAPDNIPLTLDIYVPQTGKTNYPVLVIYHGGGWLINNNSIMHDLSTAMASKGEFVVANMNYRLLVDQNNTVKMNQIVEDVFGGLLWVKDHIANYQGDPTRIAVTGDSAGGHLASMIVTRGRQLESDGFAGETLGFNPVYLPKGKTAEQIAKEDGLKVQAAIISYGVFDIEARARADFETEKNNFWKLSNARARGLFGDGINVNTHEEFYRAISPLYAIPKASDYKLPPQFVHVGSADKGTPPAMAEEYVNRLKAAGQRVEYKVYPNKNHAYLDNGCNWANSCFDRDALWPVEDMIAFLNKTLRPGGK